MNTAYRVRYFFEWGTATCMWSADEQTQQTFGNPIDPQRLPLSHKTIEMIEQLCGWYQGALNWTHPTDPGPWRQAECDRFNAAARDMLDTIRRELGSTFKVVNEYSELRDAADLDGYLRDPQGFRRHSQEEL